ncbi:MAG: beta-N-acetylhexosaminidase [Clostridia bacterium]|nr:beta-N-acetylhexosaminidase [Clostridia bacterium]
MFKRFGVMMDMSRNGVMKPEQVKQYALTIKKLGYNMIQLYTEDTYEIPEEPYFGYLRGRYSKEELKDIVEYCNSIEIEVIPCIQTLAHLNQMFYWKEFQQFRDQDDVLLVGDERTYNLIEKMFKNMRECFTSNLIHIGMDEAHSLGRGQYLDIHGGENRYDIIRKHLERVICLAEKYGFRPIMWSDMFFRIANNGDYFSTNPDIISDEILASCPDGVDQVYWDYHRDKKEHYDVMLESHKRFGGESWFAGGAWTWMGFASNNDWSLKTMLPAMQSCREKDVQNIMMTVWGNYGKLCSYYAVLPSLYAIRRFYDGVEDMAQIKEEFGKITGENFDNMMKLDIRVDVGPVDKEYSTTPYTYLLFNDPLLGMVDAHIVGSRRKEFEEVAEQFENAAKTSKFSTIFKSQAALCRALAVKYDLGVRTRKAYREKNMDEIKTICDDYLLAMTRIEEFVACFRRHWFEENKPHGVDVIEIRIGALLMRLRFARERLISFMAGDIDKIDELDEEILLFRGHGCNAVNHQQLPALNRWICIASPNNL